MRILWEWANDPVVRSNSFHPEPIGFEDHCEWYERKLASPDCRIWIACDEDVPAGQIRYERAGPHAEVDISVAAEQRGRGIAQMLLRETAGMACRELGVVSLIALVLEDNAPSLRAFDAAGYLTAGLELRYGRRAVRLERACGMA